MKGSNTNRARLGGQQVFGVVVFIGSVDWVVG